MVTTIATELPQLVDDQWYKPAEAAPYVRRSRETLMRYARRGLIGYSRPGGKEYLFSGAHIRAFLSGSEVPVQAKDAPAPKPRRNPRYAK